MPYYSGGGLSYAAQSASNSQQTIQNALNSLSQSLRFQQQLEEQRRAREAQEKAQAQARKDANLRFGIGLGTSIATDFIAPAAIGAFAGGQENVVSPEVGELPESAPEAPRVLANTPMSLTGGVPGSGAPILAGSRPDLGIGTTKYAYGNTLGQSVGRGALAGLASRLAPGVMATSTALNPNLVYNRAVQGLELGQKYAALGLQAKNIEYDHLDRQAGITASIENSKRRANRSAGGSDFQDNIEALKQLGQLTPEQEAEYRRNRIAEQTGQNRVEMKPGDYIRAATALGNPVSSIPKDIRVPIANAAANILGQKMGVGVATTQPSATPPPVGGMPIGAKTRTVGGKLYYQDDQDGKWYPAR